MNCKQQIWNAIIKHEVLHPRFSVINIPLSYTGFAWTCTWLLTDRTHQSISVNGVQWEARKKCGYNRFVHFGGNPACYYDYNADLPGLTGVEVIVTEQSFLCFRSFLSSNDANTEAAASLLYSSFRFVVATRLLCPAQWSVIGSIQFISYTDAVEAFPSNSSVLHHLLADDKYSCTPSLQAIVVIEATRSCLGRCVPDVFDLFVRLSATTSERSQ